MPESTPSITGISGISGSGKSTLLRLIAGLETPQTGSIHYNKKTWYNSEKNLNLSPQQRNLSLMFPGKQLFANLNVSENIEYANNSPQSASQWLKQFNLSHLAKRKTTHLSQGEQQRLAFIRALARKPQLLLLDEPFSAINSELKPNYYQALKHYQTEWNMSTIIVSHNQNELEQLSSQLYQLEHCQLHAY